MDEEDDTDGSELPLVVDPAREQLAALNFPEASLEIGSAHAFELVERAKAVARGPVGMLDGPVAASYLETLIPIVIQEILVNQNAYSSVRWLWYLRRLPADFFGGGYTTTIGYDRGLAESLTWFSKGSEASHKQNIVAFRIDDSTIRHLGRFVANVKVLSHLQIAYRRVGKGASLDTRGRVPVAETPTKVEDAIRVYDIRHDDRSGSMLQGLGLSDVKSDTRALSAELDKLTGEMVYLVSHSTPHIVPAIGPDGTGQLCAQRVLANHAFGKIPLVSLLYPFGRDIPYPLPFVEAAEPLITLLLMFPVFAAHTNWALTGALQVGYFFTPQERFKSIVDVWLPKFRKVLAEIAPDIDWSASYEQWRSRLDNLVPGIWPLHAGGVIRPYLNNHLLVDLSAASSALIVRVRSDRTASELANSRALTYELQVQALIDGTKWRPSSSLAALRGRSLLRKHSSETFTDIDAIGTLSSTLLIVSCKSLIYDGLYDKGDYKTIRNAKSTVDGAVQHWQTIAGTIRSDPVGANFDFSSFTRIVAVVCTPFVIYSDSAETLAYAVEGLRFCVSTIELGAWLRTTG